MGSEVLLSPALAEAKSCSSAAIDSLPCQIIMKILCYLQ